MAKGYTLNTPRRRNPSRRAVRMVNPRPSRRSSGWSQARVMEPTRRVARPAGRPKKRNPSRGKSADGRVVPNTRKAGKSKRTATPKRNQTTRSATARVVGASKNSSGRKTTRKRSRSRNPAGKATKVATAKKRPGYRWRKGYTRSDGTRVKGGWVKKNAGKKTARKNTGRKPARARVISRNAGRRKTVRKNASRKTKRGHVWVKGYTRADGSKVKGHWAKKARRNPIKKVKRKRALRGAEPSRTLRTAAKKPAAKPKKRKVAKRKRALRGAAPARTLRTAPAKKPAAKKSAATGPGGKRKPGYLWVKGFTRKDGVKVKGHWMKKPKGRRYRVRGYTKKSGRKVKSYLRSRPGRRRKTASSKKRKPGHVWVKGYTRSDGVKVKGHWAKKAKKARRAAPKRRKTTGRKRVKSYLRRVPGRKARKRVKSYLRKPTTKRRKAVRKNPTKRPSKGAVWVKGYTRSDGVRVKGHWMRPAKKRRKAKAKRKRSTRVKSYLRKVPGRRRRTRVKSYTRKLAPKRRAKSRKRTNGRRKGKMVHVKGYTRSDGVKVKSYSYKRKKTNRSGRGRITRNPHKRGTRVKSYLRKAPGRKRRKRVKSYTRDQWYPHRDKGRWISMAKAGKLGLLTQREKKALARRMAANPGSGLMALLPATEQLKIVGKKVGVGTIGFGGAVALGVALNRVPKLTQYLGTWTPVLGNVAAGLGFWAIASASGHEGLKEMRVPVAVGAGLAAVVNLANNLVARQTIPSRIASWILPGAGAVAAAPTEVVEPTLPATNGDNGASGFGQIDVYEAALDGFGGIEEELEMELSRMGMADGIFDTSPDGIFDGMSGMGTMVEEAFAGGRGAGEYLEVPMGTGEYLEVPMGGNGVGEYLEVPQMGGMGASVEAAYAGMGRPAMVEEAYAGAGEYLEVPMGTGEYLEVPMGGMGASVEAAYAGMGQANGGEATATQVEESLRNHPLMPGFRGAVQAMVRKRIASGQPLDNEFYGKVGRAAASLARKKFQQRVQAVGGQLQDLPVEPWRSPVLRSSAPMYTKPVGDPALVPGAAESIPGVGPQGNQGIFSDTDDDGIF